MQITHPLSVSMNKLGDMEYSLGNVEAAEEWYQKGLAVRQQALSSSQQPQPSQQLDVAVSMIKVADANQVCSASSTQLHHILHRQLQSRALETVLCLSLFGIAEYWVVLL